MILGTLSYNPPTRTVVQRQHTAGFVLGWYTHTIIQSGQYSIFRETPFGGYRMHIKFKDWFWNFCSSSAPFPDIIDFMYATAPGSSTPISFNNMQINIKYAGTPVNANVINLQLLPNDNHYTFWRAPVNPNDDYWLRDDHTYPATLQYNT